ncbi:MAG: hypothetical protein SO411_06555, partial [Bacteroidaceae bacterium]|nr:hypothetical protein [Bacteroidaceae bacterium]
LQPRLQIFAVWCFYHYLTGWIWFCGHQNGHEGMHPNGMLTHFWGSKISKTDGLEGRIHVYKHTEEGFFCTNQA